MNSTIGNNTGLSEFEVYGNPATDAVVGNMDNGNSYDSCGTDLTLCRYYAGQSIVANLVKANIVASPGKVKCAIYGDNAGTPGAMLMDTNELTAPKAGWTTFNLVSPITLNSGTYYWIAIWSNGDLKVAADLTGSGLYTGSYTYGILPNSPTGTTTNGFTHCLYAEGTLSSGTKYEAENGTKRGTCYSDTNGFGYSGAGYLAGIDLAVGNSVSMTVNVTTGVGSHNIDFRYSNGTGTSKTLSIYVNGTHVENLSFPATGGWDTTWATVNSSFTLNAGNNTIKIQYDSGDGPVDIDYIRVY